MSSVPSDTAKGEVASVLSALGQLMHDLQQQDIALQKAVTELASSATEISEDLLHMQHLDLITQTHEDLARFLPELAACLEHKDFDHQKLAQKLQLRSLKDQLLGQKNATNNPTPKAGDVSFF